MKPQSSLQIMGEDLTLGIHGPPKSGKTVTALTASKYFETFPRPRKSEVISIKDMLWLQIDTGATDTVSDSRYDVPVFTWPQAMKEGKTESKAAKLLLDWTKEYVQDVPECKFIVVDTVSLLDKAFVTRYSEVHKDSDNSYAVWTDVLGAHRRFHMRLKALPVVRLYLFHSKAEATPDKKQKKAADDKKAANEAINSTVHPDISGQSLQLYRGEVSGMYSQFVKRGPTGDKHLLSTDIRRSVEAGTRFQLDKEIPANLQILFNEVGIMREYYG